MAEHGAHITGNLQIKPSIFELLAADSLNSTFYPAIKRIVNFLVTNNPERYNWTLKYYDEIYMILNGVLQNYYLKHHNGSLSEVFYGISRYSTKSDGFSRRDRLLSFVLLIVLPYLKIKLKTYLDEKATNLTTHNSRKYQLCLRTYNAAESVYEFLRLFQFISYLANRSKSHTPVLRLIDIGLQYIPQDEDELGWSWRDLFGGKLKIATILSDVLFRGLELSAFFLQFLQWWQNESTQKNITELPVPPPPDRSVDGDRYRGICPLCLQTWNTPTVVSISGFVYCFKCIMNHLDESKTCPVSKYPATIDDLIRIYDKN